MVIFDNLMIFFHIRIQASSRPIQESGPLFQISIQVLIILCIYMYCFFCGNFGQFDDSFTFPYSGLAEGRQYEKVGPYCNSGDQRPAHICRFSHKFSLSYAYGFGIDCVSWCRHRSKLCQLAVCDSVRCSDFPNATQIKCTR